MDASEVIGGRFTKVPLFFIITYSLCNFVFVKKLYAKLAENNTWIACGCAWEQFWRLDVMKV